MVKLKVEFDYYLANQDELVEKYKGKYLVIIGNEVVGVYDDEIEAYTKSARIYPQGTFLLQECQPGSENYTQSFRSRVRFD